MFKKFSVRHFRGFQDFEINGLKQITLIGGKNNVGKTSLLEGLFVHCGKTNAELITRTNNWRGLLPGLVPSRVDRADLARYFIGPSFYDGDLSAPIRFESVSENGQVRTSEITARAGEPVAETLLPAEREPGVLQPGGIVLKLGHVQYKEDGQQPAEHDLVLSIRGAEVGFSLLPESRLSPIKAHFIHEGLSPVAVQDATMYSSLREQGRESLVLQGLRAIDPLIKSLEVLSPTGTPTLYANLVSGKRMQLPLLGQGSSRLTHILLVMIGAASGVMLVDEMAYGLHYSVLPEVWKVISSAAREFDVQVIATTHSFEVISAAYRAFSDLKRLNQFAYFRLEASEDRISAIQVDQKSLGLAIDAGFEIR